MSEMEIFVDIVVLWRYFNYR